MEVAEAPEPVETKAVEGTDWEEVRCKDGRVYYFNSDTDVRLRAACMYPKP